jgi:hypothetical protein
MEKYEPPASYSPPTSRAIGSRPLENLLTLHDEYGTGFRASPSGKQRERPVKNDISVRTLDLPESYSLYPGITHTIQ